MEEINPEFELFISKFNSQKIYVTNNQDKNKDNNENDQLQIKY